MVRGEAFLIAFDPLTGWSWRRIRSFRPSDNASGTYHQLLDMKCHKIPEFINISIKNIYIINITSILFYKMSILTCKKEFVIRDASTTKIPQQWRSVTMLPRLFRTIWNSLLHRGRRAVRRMWYMLYCGFINDNQLVSREIDTRRHYSPAFKKEFQTTILSRLFISNISEVFTTGYENALLYNSMTFPIASD